MPNFDELQTKLQRNSHSLPLDKSFIYSLVGHLSPGDSKVSLDPVKWGKELTLNNHVSHICLEKVEGTKACVNRAANCSVQNHRK